MTPADSPFSAAPEPTRQASAAAGRPTRARYVLMGYLCSAATIAYISRNSIAAAESTIRRDMGLSEKEMGTVMSAFFLVYALNQIPSGWFGHIWGSRRALPLFAVLWSLATMAFALVGAAWHLIVSRGVNGLAQAGLFPCAVNSISRWLPITQRALANGSLASFMSLGGAIGQGLTGVLLLSFDWRQLFFAYGGLGILWAWLFYVWFRNEPEDHPGVNEAELAVIRDTTAESDKNNRHARPAANADDESAEKMPAENRHETADEDSHPPTPWLAMAASPAMWCICGQQFFRAAGFIFFSSWINTYLQQTRGVSVAASGLLSMLPLMAVVVGGFLGGGASDWVLKKTGSRRMARQGLAVVNLVLCASMIFIAYFIENATLAVLVISAGQFFFAIGGPTSYTITIDMGGRHVAPVFSTMNMSGNIGAFLLPMATPWFKDLTGTWDSVLLLFASMYFAAAVCWLMLNPNGTIFEQSLIRPKTEGTGR